MRSPCHPVPLGMLVCVATIAFCSFYVFPGLALAVSKVVDQPQPSISVLLMRLAFGLAVGTAIVEAITWLERRINHW